MAGLATKRTVVEAMTAADDADGDAGDENDGNAFGNKAYQDVDDEQDDLDDSHDHDWQKSSTLNCHWRRPEQCGCPVRTKLSTCRSMFHTVQVQSMS